MLTRESILCPRCQKVTTIPHLPKRVTSICGLCHAILDLTKDSLAQTRPSSIFAKAPKSVDELAAEAILNATNQPLDFFIDKLFHSNSNATRKAAQTMILQKLLGADTTTPS